MSVYAHTCLSPCMHVHMYKGQKGTLRVPIYYAPLHYTVIIPLNVELCFGIKIPELGAPEILLSLSPLYCKHRRYRDLQYTRTLHSKDFFMVSHFPDLCFRLSFFPRASSTRYLKSLSFCFNLFSLVLSEFD